VPEHHRRALDPEGNEIGFGGSPVAPVMHAAMKGDPLADCRMPD
jgi:hypothetical protein